MSPRYATAEAISFKLTGDLREQLLQIAERRGGCSLASLLRLATLEFIERQRFGADTDLESATEGRPEKP